MTWILNPLESTMVLFRNYQTWVSDSKDNFQRSKQMGCPGCQPSYQEIQHTLHHLAKQYLGSPRAPTCRASWGNYTPSMVYKGLLKRLHTFGTTKAEQATANSDGGTAQWKQCLAGSGQPVRNTYQWMSLKRDWVTETAIAEWCHPENKDPQTIENGKMSLEPSVPHRSVLMLRAPKTQPSRENLLGLSTESWTTPFSSTLPTPLPRRHPWSASAQTWANTLCPNAKTQSHPCSLHALAHPSQTCLHVAGFWSPKKAQELTITQ